MILIKNYPEDASLLKNIVKNFLVKNHHRYDKTITHYSFYKYTSDTKYFLKNREDPGGFSSEELSNYPQDEIAMFIITKCGKDTAKLVGELIYYGLEGSGGTTREIDTLTYKYK